jgi:hypothetical protein
MDALNMTHINGQGEYMSDTQESSASAAEEVTPDLQDAVADVVNGEESQEQQAKSADPVSKDMDKAIANMKKKLKLKVDGEEIEEEFDFADEERMKRELQKARAFDKRAPEYANFKKQVDQLMEMLQKDPSSVMSQLGHNMDELAENHLKRRIEEAKKSPQQLAQEKMEKELNEAKSEAKKLKEEKETAELEKLRNEHASMIEKDIQVGLEKADTILPKKNPWVLRQIAQTMLLAMKNGHPNVSVSDVIPFVERQFNDDLKSMFDIFPEEVIERVVGKNNLDRLRKKRIKEQKNTQTANQVVKSTNSKPSEKKDEGPKKKFKDIFDFRS